MNKQLHWATLHPFLESGDILGRGVANAGFLRAFLKADPFASYSFFLANSKQADRLEEALHNEFSALAQRGALHFKTFNDLPDCLQQNRYHCFHLSDWVSHFTALARLRNYLAAEIFPITGVTHSLSYARYAPVFLSHLWPGVTGRDAVIATSRTGVGVLKAAFKCARENYHLSVQEFKAPELVRIPLGVEDNPDLAPDSSSRRESRKMLGLGEDTVMLLVMGRISHYSKMDILPLLRALHRLKNGGFDLAGVRVCLAGWVDETDDTPQMLGKLAKAMGLKLSVHARPDDAERNRLYRAADIFVSIADNAQETFGLTVLEAGLAGLPVVVSEYNGYRDTVEHNKTGLLIPTLGPAQTEYTDILSQLWYDSQYHLRLAQETVVSVPVLAESLQRLITDPALRARLGAAGRQRVLSEYTWGAVIARYLELWERLRAVPVEAEALRAVGHPMQFSFAELFAGYTTNRLMPDLSLVWTRSGEALYRGQEAPVYYAGVEAFILEEALRKMLFQARKPVTVAALREAFSLSGLHGEAADAHILWALKHDFLEIAGHG